MINPFLVACPTQGGCGAPAGERCHIGNPRIANDDGQAVHAIRRDTARLRTAVHGTCALCGRLMVHMTDPDETRHPTTDEAGPIPPCPPWSDQEGWNEWTPTGAEAFTPYDVQPEPPADQPNPPPPRTYDPLPLPSPEDSHGPV